MSISDHTIQAVTKLLYGQNTNTLDTGKYLLVHHPDPADHTTVTTVVINESNAANPEYGQTRLETNQVFPDNIYDTLNNENDSKDILYEARAIDVKMEKPTSTSEQHYSGKGHKHYIRKHPCNVCKKLFFSPWQVKRHEVVHQRQNCYTCSTCNQSFSQLQRLESHQSIHTGQWKFTCTECNAHFNEKFQFNKHLVKNQHGEYESVPRRYYFKNCKVCGKEFVRGSLNVHMLTHLTEEERNRLKVHKCTKCGRGFMARYDLMTHIASHSEVRPFICNTCRQCFKTKKRLLAHHHRCSGVFKCQFCDMSFANARWLRKHIETHHSEHSESLQSDKTNIIKTSAVKTNTLNTNIVKKKIFPYSCKTCKCCYYTKKTLMDHQCRCTGGKVTHVDCKICGKSFSDDIWLGKHVKKRHQNRTEKLKGEKPKTEKLNENHTEKLKSEKRNEIFRLPPDELDHDTSASYTSGPKTFHTCGICFKQFAKTTFVRVHMRKHSSTDVCSCEKCNTWFTVNSELNDHICEHASTISNADFD